MDLLFESHYLMLTLQAYLEKENLLFQKRLMSYNQLKLNSQHFHLYCQKDQLIL
jgi:hypothetical protein